MGEAGQQRRNLVAITADRLRDKVFVSDADSLIGSLPELAKAMGVGTATIQQAARILEHEGLLAARRGPGGGYYGKRPNRAAVERSVAAYLRSNPASYDEALNITSLLFNELAAAAAGCRDEARRDDLVHLLDRLGTCQTGMDCGDLERDFQDVLFRMVNWPLFRLLTVVTLQLAGTQSGQIVQDDLAVADWVGGRRRIIDAILAGDQDLARFEADRSNRRAVLRRITRSA